MKVERCCVITASFQCNHLYHNYFQLTHCTAFKANCTIWVRRSNFRHQASLRVSPRESTQRRKAELWARNVRKFCLNFDFQRYIYESFTWDRRLYFHSMCWEFFRPKNPTASAGCEPAKGQHATSRPTKPLVFQLYLQPRHLTFNDPNCLRQYITSHSFLILNLHNAKVIFWFTCAVFVQPFPTAAFNAIHTYGEGAF
jgi:hypothetical protein